MMKKLLTTLPGLFIIAMAVAQAPAQINYQGVARKANGHPNDNQMISIRLTIRDGSPGGPVVYKETRAVLTNEFGLFAIAIGSPGATGVVGSIPAVNWGGGSKYLQVEMDPNGGSLFTDMGTSQLLSVPYALFSGSGFPVGPAGGDLSGSYPNPTVARIRGVNVTPTIPLVNQVLGYDGVNWTPTSLSTHPDNYWRASGSNIYNANSGNVGIGTTIPVEKLDVNGNLRTLGFNMPTGAGAGKVLTSNAAGVGSWSSDITASKLALPYKDSASSETDHIFHIIQTSTTSLTAGLFGESRSAAAGAVAVGGRISSLSPGGGSVALRGENLSTTGLGIGVWGSQNGNGWGVLGSTPNGIGVYGTSEGFYGVYGTSVSSSGVFGASNAGDAYLAGVFGYAPGNAGNGTFGYATQNRGYGALGISEKSIGVYGQTNAASFAATANDGAAVYATANSGGTGVYSRSFTGISGRFENVNPANNSTTLEVETEGTGRAIVARSNFPGYSFAGVVDSWTSTVGGNAIFARGTRTDGWGVLSLSDSSVAVGAYGYRAGSVAVRAQGWSGTSGLFIIDNTLPNTSNTVDVFNSQSGRGINVSQTGSGNGIYSAISNPASIATGIYSTTNGTGYAIHGFSEKSSAILGFSSLGYGAGVYGYNNGVNGNGLIGWGTRFNDWGLAAHSDSSIAVYGESNTGNAGYFYNYGSNTTVPALYAQTFGKSNAASFNVLNPSNSDDAVVISHVGTGRGLFASGSHFSNVMDFYNVLTGKQTIRAEGNSGIAVLGHSVGTFVHSVTGERVGVGVYGQADSTGSHFNYGIVGNGKGGSLENAGVVGWIAGGSAGSARNAAIYGIAFAGPSPRYAGLFEGDVQVTGTLSKGAGTFKIDHPLDPQNKYLVHSFVESPDMMNVYNGNITTNAEGKAIVQLPSYFQAENIDFKYQLTVIGQFAQAIIGEEINDNSFVILTDKPNVKVSWQVTGVRNDKFAQAHRIIPEVEKKGVEKGKYLYPEVYGQPRENGISFMKGGIPSFKGEQQQATSRSNAVNTNKDQEEISKTASQKITLMKNHVPQNDVKGTGKVKNGEISSKKTAQIPPAKESSEAKAAVNDSTGSNKKNLSKPVIKLPEDQGLKVQKN